MVHMLPQFGNCEYLYKVTVKDIETLLKDYIKDYYLTKNNNQAFLKTSSDWV